MTSLWLPILVEHAQLLFVGGLYIAGVLLRGGE